MERGARCQRCGRIIAKSIEIIGHHKTPLTPENVNDVLISLNPENVDLVCFDCHNIIEKRFGYKQTKNIYIVYGPPLSGKSSLVKQRMNRGDVIVDMDRLYEAVTMLPSYDKPQELFSNVMGVHNLLIDNIRTRYGKWNNAWIVGGYADKFKRERLADDLGAELVFCDVQKDECLRRLDADEDRRFRKDEWIRFINEWFDKYGG